MAEKMSISKWKRTMYASTDIAMGRTQGEIMSLLHQYRAGRIAFEPFQSGGGAVYFEIDDRQYRIDAVPIEVEVPEKYTGDIARLNEKRIRQAWRFLYHYLKALMGLEFFAPADELLIPFMLMPGQGRKPRTIAELLKQGGRVALPEHDDDS